MNSKFSSIFVTLIFGAYVESFRPTVLIPEYDGNDIELNTNQSPTLIGKGFSNTSFEVFCDKKNINLKIFGNKKYFYIDR